MTLVSGGSRYEALGVVVDERLVLVRHGSTPNGINQRVVVVSW